MPPERPKIADLTFRLYDRPLHPELFDAAVERTFVFDGAAIAVRLTPTGHVLAWSRGSSHLIELTAARTQDLPEGQRLDHPFLGERRGRWEHAGIRYQVCLQAERLAPELFVQVHDELVADGSRRGMLGRFAPHHRLALAPLGLAIVEPVRRGICTATFHTFPAECAVVKTQSLIEDLDTA
jgi:hypothetical protein